MKPACPRAFEAAALRDGRIADAEAASFERHLRVCAHCSREVEALRALGEALRSSVASRADADELHVRRERTRLLAAFDKSLVGRPERRGLTGALVALAFAGAVLFGAFVYLSQRSPPADVMGSAVRVHADGAASWSRRVEGAVEKIQLERGALSISVDRALERRRLLVILPDGELEDIGTTFTVSADAGRTTRVSVQSGSVVLRLRGQPSVVLSPGDTWIPSAQRALPTPCPSCAAPSVSAPTPESPPSVTPASPLAPAPARRPLASPGPPRSSPPALPSSVPEPVAAVDFRAALAALDHGDNSAAAARFSAFLAAHPRDSRVEDAAYLRVIALQRTGNAANTREAALQYLRQYPSGFRRAEIEALAAPANVP